MNSNTGPPTKKQKAGSADRSIGVVYTLSAPSKVKQAGNALLSLFDPLHVDQEIVKSSDTNRSISDEIEEELRALNKSNKRFKFSSELSRGVGLIAFAKGLVPSDFVYDLLSNHCPHVPPLFVCRIDPVDVVCAPNLISFETVSLPAIASKFKSMQEDITWKVVYDKHGESNISKEKAIDLIQSVIEDRHESMLGVGFLRDYDKLCEYNIRKLVASRVKDLE